MRERSWLGVAIHLRSATRELVPTPYLSYIAGNNVLCDPGSSVRFLRAVDHKAHPPHFMAAAE